MKYYCIIFFLLLLNTGMIAQWSKTDFNDSDVLLCVDFNGSNGVMGGWHLPSFVNAYYTDDQGTTWYNASTPDSLRVITDLQVINDTLIYGCGAKNKIMSFSRSFPRYDELFSDRERYHLFKQGIFSAPDHNLYRAQFLKSTDRGHSWQYKGSLSDTIAYLVDLQFLSQNGGYTLAYNDSSSGLLKTADGGNTWHWSFLAGQSVGLYSFDFLDSLNGFIAGEDPTGGLIVKTTDGGDTWSPILINGTTEISKIKCVAPSTVIVSGYDINSGENIFISSDNGSTWNQVFSHPNLQIDGINGLSGGWIIFYGTYYPTGSSTPFVNGTKDMGQTWVESTLTPLTDIILGGSRMIDNDRWYITGTYMLNSGFLLHTLNSGGLPVELISFTAQQTGNSIRLQWTTASETNNLGFEIQRKSLRNEFMTIGFVNGKGSTTEKHSYSFTDRPDNIGEKITYRLKQLDFDGSVSYSDEICLDLIGSTDFILKQNYPNPFNPTTTIGFGIQDKTNVKISVLNSIGEEVAVILNEEIESGYHEVEFNAINLPSGVYFYQLKAGNYLATKKMILLK